MSRKSYNVDGMSCAHCEGRVREALTALEGVSVIEVSAAESRVIVDYDQSRVSEETLKAAVKKAGYRVLH
jgi:copper chaperone